MTLQSDLRLTINARQSDALDVDVGDPEGLSHYVRTIQLLTGTGSGQNDQAVVSAQVAPGSGSTEIDLTGQPNILGQPMNFTNIKLMAFFLRDGNADEFMIGPGTTNPWSAPFSGTTPRFRIGRGGICIMSHPTTGWAVTAGSADRLIFINTDTSAATIDCVFSGVGTLV